MERIRLGAVGVDSGQLVIADPCYHSIETGRQDFSGLHHQLGDDGLLGIVFDSGFGDGLYEVFAEIERYGQWGKRVKRVEIILIEDDEEDAY